MARPSKYERRVTKLQCNRCDHRFQDRVMHVSIETVDRGTLGWVPRSFDGLACPACGLEAIGPQR